MACDEYRDIEMFCDIEFLAIFGTPKAPPIRDYEHHIEQHKREGPIGFYPFNHTDGGLNPRRNNDLLTRYGQFGILELFPICSFDIYGSQKVLHSDEYSHQKEEKLYRLYIFYTTSFQVVTNHISWTIYKFGASTRQPTIEIYEDSQQVIYGGGDGQAFHLTALPTIWTIVTLERHSAVEAERWFGIIERDVFSLKAIYLTEGEPSK